MHKRRRRDSYGRFLPNEPNLKDHPTDQEFDHFDEYEINPLLTFFRILDWLNHLLKSHQLRNPLKILGLLLSIKHIWLPKLIILNPLLSFLSLTRINFLISKIFLLQLFPNSMVWWHKIQTPCLSLISYEGDMTTLLILIR